MTVADPRFKPMAWGGIELRVPRDWAPHRVGCDHLVLAAGEVPTMEIKWRGAEGPSAVGRALRRLARRLQREDGVFREQPLPIEWRRALPGRDGSAFDWEAGGRRAAGACVRCRECGTVSLVQFFRAGMADEWPVRVLESLTDHRPDGRIRWRLFDIGVDLPHAARLTRSCFQPGRFELRFRQARLAFTLYRWAPAAALLQGISLADFARRAVGEAGLRFEAATVAGVHAAVATDPRPSGIAGRVAARLGLDRVRSVRVWHVPAANRILGVRLQGPAAGVDPILNTICGAYGVDAEETDPGAADARP